MRAFMMRAAFILFQMVFIARQASGQFPFSFSPDLSLLVKTTSKGVNAFINLWEFSLEVDDKTTTQPVQRKRLEPKTILAPDDQVMMHLVPQDGSHPLYLEDKTNSDLRREFLLNHLVLEPISPNDKKVASHGGVTAATLSGRSILITKDLSGHLTVENVTVRDVRELSDGTLVYRLVTPLFNLKKKVRRAFDQLHSIDLTEAIGPPLVIPGKKPINPNAEVRSPAPPPPGEVGPPAIPPNAIGAPFARKALEGEPKAPAPPPNPSNTAELRSVEEPRPPALPPFHHSRAEPQPPAPPLESESIFPVDDPQALDNEPQSPPFGTVF